jgi:hypothetical protein
LLSAAVPGCLFLLLLELFGGEVTNLLNDRGGVLRGAVVIACRLLERLLRVLLAICVLSGGRHGGLLEVMLLML